MRWLKSAQDKSVQKPQRQEGRRLPSFKMVAFSVLGLSIISTAGYGFSQRTPLMDDLVTLSGQAGLSLDSVKIYGRHYTADDRLNAALGLYKGMPILAVDLEETRRKIEDIGWVSNARIERHLPGQLRLFIQERRPTALLQGPSGHQLIDREGAIISEADITQFGHLPVVSGDGAATEAALMLDTLKTEPDLYAEVWAIQYISERRWDVHLKNGVAIKLPESNPAIAWSRLALLDREKQITARDLIAIDMRIEGQLIVEPTIPVRGNGQKT